MKIEAVPYKECEDCRDLGDCRHLEIAEDMMGSPMPPNNCPRPMDILKETYKRKKHDRPSFRGIEPLRY